VIHLLRLILWAIAICLAGAPIFFGVLKTPFELYKIAEIESYRVYGRDLIFLAVAILAIGFVDGFEATIGLRRHRHWIPRFVSLLTSILLAFVVLTIVVFVGWSAGIGDSRLSAADTERLVQFVKYSVCAAAYCRVVLLAA